MFYKIITDKEFEEIFTIIKKVAIKQGFFEVKKCDLSKEPSNKNIQITKKIIFIEIVDKPSDKTISMFVPCEIVIIIENEFIYEVSIILKTTNINQLFNKTKKFLKEILNQFKTQE